MKIYYDVFSNDEIISDSYKMVQVFDGLVCEVKGRWLVKKEGQIDIGCGNAFGGGEEEAAEENVEKVLDLIDTYKYEQTSYGKNDYVNYFKGYIKKVLEHLKAKNPDRVEGFKEGCKQFLTYVKNNFDDFTFYTPQSYDNENIIILSIYKGEDTEPTFLYMMDGLRFEKA